MSQILIADDDPVALAITEAALHKWGYQPLSAQDGEAAWQILNRLSGPVILIVDWNMPGLNGIELCQKIRQSESLQATYVMMLTSSSGSEYRLTGLSAGVDDYLEKPLDAVLFKRHIQMAERIVSLQFELSIKTLRLQQAYSQIKELRALLPLYASRKSPASSHNGKTRLEHQESESCREIFVHIASDCDDLLSQEFHTFKENGSENNA